MRGGKGGKQAGKKPRYKSSLSTPPITSSLNQEIWQIFQGRINLPVSAVNTAILFPARYRKCDCHIQDLLKNILPGCLNVAVPNVFKQEVRRVSAALSPPSVHGNSGERPTPSHGPGRSSPPRAVRLKPSTQLHRPPHSPAKPFPSARRSPALLPWGDFTRAGAGVLEGVGPCRDTAQGRSHHARYGHVCAAVAAGPRSPPSPLPPRPRLLQRLAQTGLTREPSGPAGSRACRGAELPHASQRRGTRSLGAGPGPGVSDIPALTLPRREGRQTFSYRPPNVCWRGSRAAEEVTRLRPQGEAVPSLWGRLPAPGRTRASRGRLPAQTHRRCMHRGTQTNILRFPCSTGTRISDIAKL